MYSLFRGTRRILWVLPEIYPDSPSSSWSLDLAIFQGKNRYATAPKTKRQKPSRVNILSFIGSSFHYPRGQSHCWLNLNSEKNKFLKGDGIFLVVVSEDFESSFEANQDAVKMFANAKLLQQRCPSLQVLAVQCTQSKCFSDISTKLFWRFMKEYITFPILLCDKNVIEIDVVPCYIISKGLKNYALHRVDNCDVKLLETAINDLNLENAKRTIMDDTRGSWVKPFLFVREPDVCSASRNLLFSFPGCISADEDGNRFFLSDVNHHRIIVFDGEGKILDAIGSLPGFEDGDFESARLLRPAASMYQASENVLYFVDSENHAVRKADMVRRAVQTVFPSSHGRNESKGVWPWILDKIWKKKDTKFKSEDYKSESFSFPWHLLKSPDNSLLVLDQRCETLWILDFELGLIRETITESSKILKICQQTILDKCMPLSQLPALWSQQQLVTSCSMKGFPHAGLMSSVANHQDHIIFCDAVGQTVVKFRKGSESPASFQFSNFGVLGVPYWLGSSLEKLYTPDDISGVDVDHSQCFDLLPGTVNIKLNVDIPADTRLVEDIQEGCIWRQAKGAAIEVTGVENKAAAVSEKVGSAQLWYDELDNLSFSEMQEESSNEDVKEEDKAITEEVQDGRICIRSTINTSPGTSEAIIYASLYLRLVKNEDPYSCQEKQAARIADMLEPKTKWRKDVVMKLLMSSGRDMEEIIFMRPVHVRLKFSSGEHPKAENTKGIMLTDSCVEVHVNL